MIQIAACVFTCFDPEKGVLEVKVEKLYLYLNNLGIGEGGHALVHNGRDFGVVRVIRNFTPSSEHAIYSKVTRPLLCSLWIGSSDIKSANIAIARIREDAQVLRLNAAAEALLGTQQKEPETIYPPPSPDYQL